MMPSIRGYGLPGFLAITALLAYPAQAAEEATPTVTVAPTLTTESPNLVVNGNFEQATDNSPAGWDFLSANPEIYRTTVTPIEGKGHVLEFSTPHEFMSGYWSQKLPLKANTAYLMTAQVRITDGSKMLIYITQGDPNGANEFRTYVESTQSHPLAPLFWDNQWLTGSRPDPARTVGPNVATRTLVEPDQWTPVSMPFKTGDQPALMLRLGAFFAAGTYAIDDVVVREVQP